MPSPAPNSRLHLWYNRLLWFALGACALAGLAFNIWIGLDLDDSGNLETTLAYAAAGQFDRGPGSLYGPFSRSNPFVLIQAPVYFRLTGLLAAPMVTVGARPIDAVFLAGRAISFVSFLGCLLIAAKLASRDGAASCAGVWSALLVAASPLLAGFPVTVRPDMFGVCIQSLGVLMLLRASTTKKFTSDDSCPRSCSSGSPCVSSSTSSPDGLRERLCSHGAGSISESRCPKYWRRSLPRSPRCS